MAAKKKSGKAAGVMGAVLAVGAIAKELKPFIDVGQDIAENAMDERKNLITVPILYPKGYKVTAEQAVEALKNAGLTCTLVISSLEDADPKYRTYIPSQVIETNPPSKSRVEAGANILVKYITQDVIDESQRMFDEAEAKKAATLQAKAEKKTLRKEKTKQAVSAAIDTAKKGVSKIPAVIHKEHKAEAGKGELEF